MFVFFFFKQKTAYEMRISDWSSDVCSSDLTATGRSALRQAGRRLTSACHTSTPATARVTTCSWTRPARLRRTASCSRSALLSKRRHRDLGKASAGDRRGLFLWSHGGGATRQARGTFKAGAGSSSIATMEGFEMAFALGRSVLGPAIGGAVLGGMEMLAGKMLSNKRNIQPPGAGEAVRSGAGRVRSEIGRASWGERGWQEG